jgi:DNA-binding beta-propeller fold protein YncE
MAALFRRPTTSAIVIAIVAAVGHSVVADEPPLVERPQFRRPTALTWLADGNRLLTVNRRSGTLSIVDVARRCVVAEQVVGERPTALVNLGTRDRFALLDEQTHELIVLQIDARHEVDILGRTGTSSDPVGVAIADDGCLAAVACRWSRTVDVVALRPADDASPVETWNAAFPRVVGSIPLDFAPRTVVRLPDDRIAVLDAFGGRLAVVDLDRRVVVAVHTLDAHNLHGAAVDTENGELLIAGQHSNSHVPTTAENLQQGLLIQNRLFRIRLTHLVQPTPLPASAVAVASLDRPGIGGGDPAGLALIGSTTLVCLAGVGKLAVVDVAADRLRTYDVGRRPLEIAVADDGRRAAVVNQLSDSVSIVDVEHGSVVEIALGPQPEPYPRDRGEALFYDARVSAGGYFSCHSCHTNGHTNGRLADTLGDETYGTPKRIVTLRGTSLTDPWAWNGGLRELRDQVRQSFETTMHATSLRAEQSDDVVAYLHTLPFPPPLRSSTRDDADRQLLDRGRTLFAQWRCGECHVGPLTYTSPGAYEVGLRDEKGLTKFNPPSLRGVGHGTAFFHDNRCATLEDVLTTERHQLPDDATEADVAALVRFLQSL